jgi:hypothetical protein
MWENIFQTYQCLIDAMEKMPELKIEDVFKGAFLSNLKAEQQFLKEVIYPYPSTSSPPVEKIKEEILPSEIMWTERNSSNPSWFSEGITPEMINYLSNSADILEQLSGENHSAFVHSILYFGYSKSILFASVKPVPDSQIVSQEFFLQKIQEDMQKEKE